LWLSNPSVNVIDNGVGKIDTLENKHESCYPRIAESQDIILLMQDNYNLLKKEKWDVVNKILDNNIPTVFENGTEYDIYGKDHTNTTMFYKNDNVLTINFMNIQAFMKLFRTVKHFADYINNELDSYLNKNPYIHNQWLILDFPSTDLIRRIYNSIDQRLNKRDNLQYNTIEVGDYSVYTDLYYYIQTLSSVGDTDNPACLQRKTIINSQDQVQELIKTNNKCINNKKNKWFIRQNGQFYSIVSSYDAKCLNHDGKKLYMDYCKKNNKYEQFVVKNGKFCVQFDNSKCLDGKFKIIPTALESPRYEHLSCSSIFPDLGFRCCYDQNTKVEYVDEIGNWGIENGELCGIGYERCSFSILDEGYPCCSSVNPEVVMTDEKGNNWGLEDGQWCGIGEANLDSSFRIKNRKTQECLITNLHSDTSVLLMGDCNHSVWTYENEHLVLDATNKCLYAMNSQDARMVDCNEADNQINHHIHFKIVDDKYICLKNSVNPEICLNGNTKNSSSLKFDSSKGEYSEWYLERWNEKWVDSIDEVITKKPELKPKTKNIIVPKITTTIVPSSTSILEPTSNCYSKAGYPCCSPENTEVIFTDEEGNCDVLNVDLNLM